MKRVFNRRCVAAVDFFQFGFDIHRTELSRDYYEDGLRASMVFKYEERLYEFHKIYGPHELELEPDRMFLTVFDHLQQYGFEKIVGEQDVRRASIPKFVNVMESRVSALANPSVPNPFDKVLEKEVKGSELVRKDDNP